MKQLAIILAAVTVSAFAFAQGPTSAPAATEAHKEMKGHGKYSKELKAKCHVEAKKDNKAFKACLEKGV